MPFTRVVLSSCVALWATSALAQTNRPLPVREDFMHAVPDQASAPSAKKYIPAWVEFAQDFAEKLGHANAPKQIGVEPAARHFDLETADCLIQVSTLSGEVIGYESLRPEDTASKAPAREVSQPALWSSGEKWLRRAKLGSFRRKSAVASLQGWYLTFEKADQPTEEVKLIVNPNSLAVVRFVGSNPPKGAPAPTHLIGEEAAMDAVLRAIQTSWQSEIRSIHPRYKVSVISGTDTDGPLADVDRPTGAVRTAYTVAGTIAESPTFPAGEFLAFVDAESGKVLRGDLTQGTLAVPGTPPTFSTPSSWEARTQEAGRQRMVLLLAPIALVAIGLVLALSVRRTRLGKSSPQGL